MGKKLPDAFGTQDQQTPGKAAPMHTDQATREPMFAEKMMANQHPPLPGRHSGDIGPGNVKPPAKRGK